VKWFEQLDDDSRKIAIDRASFISGIPSRSIEKDWWVTLVLKILFSSTYSNFFTFKGGTSLSKGYDIIKRFSEDIDIALNLDAIGESYLENPSHNFVKNIRRKGCVFTGTEILNDLEHQFKALEIPENQYWIEAKPLRNDLPDTDPQVIFIHFRSLYASNAYVQNKVKIEFSVRSQHEPRETKTVQSLLQEYFPNEIYNDEPFAVSTIHPSLTFIEKILLLHEMYNRTDIEKVTTHRMSRHYYDLFHIQHFLNQFPAADFINRLIKHRKHYSRLNHIDYNALRIGQISIIPSDSFLVELERDYKETKSNMLYGEVPSFSEIIRSIKSIQAQFNGF
jgi:hypothetical protein